MSYLELSEKSKVNAINSYCAVMNCVGLESKVEEYLKKYDNLNWSELGVLIVNN